VRLIIKAPGACSCGDGGESVCIVIFGEESTAMWRTTCSGSSSNEEPANSHHDRDAIEKSRRFVARSRICIPNRPHTFATLK
jgi:hypothetical protein